MRLIHLVIREGQARFSFIGPHLLRFEHFGQDGQDFSLGLFVYPAQLLSKSNLIDCIDLIQDHLPLFALEGAKYPRRIIPPFVVIGATITVAIKRFISSGEMTRHRALASRLNNKSSHMDV